MTATSIEQSKRLIELGLDVNTADMMWTALNWQETEYYIEVRNNGFDMPKSFIYAWSLSALLELMPPIQELCSSTDHYFRIMCMNLVSEWHDNAVDACVEMIDKLHKKGLL